ncbi:MAG: methyltransferase domain-containing protein [Verrucomicrobia bacterium]|nr:methyltransferase domain-containing protein [Verrucomicrobiota bacterium]MDA1065534.1 methyltransferase domain-containing protein [Verrucomicrobiota bacterium]
MNPFSPVEVAHRFVGSLVSEGDHCIDATLGNGNDTVFLAQLVGISGHVLGFDVQETAVKNAQARLLGLQLQNVVTCHHGGHELIDSRLRSLGWDSIQLAMFNLGYLPGSDRSVITHSETTLVALRACLGALSPGGAISIVSYRGHAGGVDECNAIEEWFRILPRDEFFTVRYERWTKEKGITPVLFWLQRRT